METLGPYVEASVFIAHIKGESQGTRGDQDAKAIFDQILDRAKRGDYKIVTSALTIAEVFKRRSRAEMPPQGELTESQSTEVLSRFESKDILIVEIFRNIAEHAHRLCCASKKKDGCRCLAPTDALHIAAALHARCKVLLTWDQGMICHGEIEGLRIEEPRLMAIPAPAPPQAQQSKLAL